MATQLIKKFATSGGILKDYHKVRDRLHLIPILHMIKPVPLFYVRL
jgi:hypothetical protein